MSRTTFIADLIKAANALDQQSDYERKRLLENAMGIIQHVRSLLGYRFSANSESLVELRFVSTAISMGWASDAQVRVALLEAAGLIRDLHIEVDQRTSTSRCS